MVHPPSFLKGGERGRRAWSPDVYIMYSLV